MCAIGFAVTVAILPHGRATPPETAASASPEAAELTALAGDGFRIRQSARFLIAYDTPNETVTSFLGRLEGVHGTVRRFLHAIPFDVREAGDPLRVILFGEFDDFTKFAARAGLASQSAAGFYDPTKDVAAFCDTLALPQVAELRAKLENVSAEKGRRAGFGNSTDADAMSRRTQLDALVTRFNRLVVQHEATHQTLFHVGLHVRGAANPPWFVEGMACQFEIPQPDEAGTLLKVNHVRLADFRDALSVGKEGKTVTPQQLASAGASGRWIPLRDLIAHSERFSSPTTTSTYTYAQAWSLVFYLHREHRTELAAYARTVARRRPQERIDAEREAEEFESAFGPADAKFEDGWIRYLLAQRLDATEAGR